ncbi:MAG: DUF6691 family protein [Pseudomonadota bacterium]
MIRALAALLTGALFGAGLTVSGMTDTAKVQGWLDLFGDWDPTLAFVLGGAILPMLITWRVTEARGRAVLGPLPTLAEPLVDHRLIGGSILFGVGWALVGLCPGPAMAVLGYGGGAVAQFFAAMVAGMVLARALGGWR